MVNKSRRARQKVGHYYRHTVIPAAENIARMIIEEARMSGDPVVFVTGNSYMPPLRSFPAAEEVWESPHSDANPELFTWLAEHVESVLSREDVLLASPDGDNSLYAVDMRRWQLKEDAEDSPDLNGEWEPVSEAFVNNGG